MSAQTFPCPNDYENLSVQTPKAVKIYLGWQKCVYTQKDPNTPVANKNNVTCRKINGYENFKWAYSNKKPVVIPATYNKKDNTWTCLYKKPN